MAGGQGAWKEGVWSAGVRESLAGREAKERWIGAGIRQVPAPVPKIEEIHT